MSEHVRDVVRKCRHIIRVLRCRGTNDQALQAVYRSVVIDKLLNAACAWWGFTMADDCNRIEAVVHRRIHRGGWGGPDPPRIFTGGVRGGRVRSVYNAVEVRYS